MTVMDSNFAEKLYKTVTDIKRTFPRLYEKQFGKKDLQINFFYTVSSWTKEKSLRDILSGPYFTNTSNIDKVIDSIQKDICFNLTALLKPFYTVKDVDLKLVSCIEMGAYNPLTMHLINMNVPREVAIILGKTIFKEVKISEEELTDKYLSEIIKNNIDKIDFWNRIQLLHLT